MGVSPIDSTAITGFSLILHSTTQYSTSSQITGRAYAADYSSPTASNLTTAVSNMEAAYTDAAGRTQPDAIDLGAGEIGGLTIAPGLYKWGTGVLITTDVTLNGGPNDVWIFQIAGNVIEANGKRVTLSGGAQAKNIFWQVAGDVTIGTDAHFEGIVLSQTQIALQTGATVNGRLLAQSAVTLETNTVTQPAS
ncbi:MAG: ice-binding family protein [Dehalococcoidia bacterium]